MKMINPNVLNEGNFVEVISEDEDEMKTLVRCNNCGQITEYGKTRMISGFVGCDNIIEVDGHKVECYFGDLQPRVIDYKENHYELYISGKVYRWRDNAEGGLK